MKKWRWRSSGESGVTFPNPPSSLRPHFVAAAALLIVGVATLAAGNALETVIRVTPPADASAPPPVPLPSNLNASPRVQSQEELPADGFNFVSAATAGLGGGKRPPQPLRPSPANRYRLHSAERVAPQPPAAAASASTTTNASTTTAAGPTKSRYGSCLLKYHPSSCKRTDYCGTKKMCVQITGDPCCAPADGECPTTAQLDIRCVKGSPINWCVHHNDCARGALCCDTGCGYNICAERFESS